MFTLQQKCENDADDEDTITIHQLPTGGDEGAKLTRF